MTRYKDTSSLETSTLGWIDSLTEEDRRDNLLKLGLRYRESRQLNAVNLYRWLLGDYEADHTVHPLARLINDSGVETRMNRTMGKASDSQYSLGKNQLATNAITTLGENDTPSQNEANGNTP